MKNQDENRFVTSYSKYSEDAIRNWVKCRRDKRISRFFAVLLRQYCCPIFQKNGLYYVLDAGCGLGHDAQEFSKAGFNVVGVDAVKEFILYGRKMDSRFRGNNGKKAAPQGRVKFICGDYACSDLITPLIRRRLFDLIWANASLIHYPKKRLTPVLNRMASFVRPAGLFAGTFFHGKGEGVYHGSFVPGRFFARYLKDELQSHVENAGWRIRWIHTVANEERRGRWIQVIAEKR